NSSHEPAVVRSSRSSDAAAPALVEPRTPWTRSAPWTVTHPDTSPTASRTSAPAESIRSTPPDSTTTDQTSAATSCSIVTVCPGPTKTRSPADGTTPVDHVPGSIQLPELVVKTFAA